MVYRDLKIVGSNSRILVISRTEWSAAHHKEIKNSSITY